MTKIILMYFLFMLVCSSSSTASEPKYAADPEVMEQIQILSMKINDAYNNKDYFLGCSLLKQQLDYFIEIGAQDAINSTTKIKNNFCDRANKAIEAKREVEIAAEKAKKDEPKNQPSPTSPGYIPSKAEKANTAAGISNRSTLDPDD